MTDIDFSTKGETIRSAEDGANTTATTERVISLDGYDDDAYLTKPEMSRAFNCSERTLQRMVERFELPPAMTLAGRKVWIAGKLRAWLAAAADRREAEALKEARRLRAFDN